MSPVLLAAALLGLLLPSHGRQRAVALFTVAFLAILIPFNSLLYWDNRYLLPAVPFLALLGVAALQTLFAATTLTRLPRTALLVGCVALTAIEPLDFYYQVWKSRVLYAPLAASVDQQHAFLRSVLQPGDLVMAPDPGLAGWAANVPAVAQARTPEIAETVRARYFPFTVLVVELRRPRADMFGYSQKWYDIAAGTEAFGSFAVVASRSIGAQTFVVLRENRTVKGS